jgi:hypothetical protein
MIFFRNFTTPLRGIFAGNLLLLVCSLLYLVWWAISFRQNSSGGLAGVLAGVFCITAAFISGVAAIVLMSGGFYSLSQDSKSLPVRFILLGGAILLLVLLLVTVIAFHRIVTLELIIIHIWAALELSAVSVLYGIGRFGLGRAVTLAALVGIATVVALICYILYYRLNGTASYLAGMIPLIVDGFVMAFFLGVLAVS